MQKRKGKEEGRGRAAFSRNTRLETVAELALNQGGSATVPSTEDKELKNRLNKYSGYLSSLWKELSRKKKKDKLPRDARQKLLHWWQAGSSTTCGPTPQYVIELFTHRSISIMPAGPTRSCPPLQQ